jgi:hypothetical protein
LHHALSLDGIGQFLQRLGIEITAGLIAAPFNALNRDILERFI